MGRRGQSATEYIILVAIVLFGITFMVVLLSKYSSSSFDEIAISNLNNVCWDIIETSESVYYMGSPARQTIDITMPKGVFNKSVRRNDPTATGCTSCTELMFVYGASKGKPEVVCHTGIILNGTFNESRSTSPGLKHILVRAHNNYVFVNMSTAG